MASRRPEYLGEPTLAQVMRRPQWILALLLALAVAAAFAWLGRWQMDNAIRQNTDELVNTETARPIDTLTEPSAGVPEVAAGAVVSVSGSLVPGDYTVVGNRLNSGTANPEADADRALGFWVVGHLVRDSVDSAADSAAADRAASLAVAVGWAASEAEARAAIELLEQTPAGDLAIEGRYLPAEAPETPKPSDDPHAMHTMLPAYLANVWKAVPEGPVYGGYLVLHDSGSAGAELIDNVGLVPIDSVAPGAPERVSWLNVFYAIEWVVFGVVALFLWYRLARDAWEKEHELMALNAAAAAGTAPESSPENPS